MGAQSVVEELARRFGPGMSNGVATILWHNDLPDVFNRDCWATWVFKPAEGAFALAHDLAIIEQAEGDGNWRMTPLGKEVANLIQRNLEAS